MFDGRIPANFGSLDMNYPAPYHHEESYQSTLSAGDELGDMIDATVDIPVFLVGWVIGRGGRRIQELQMQTKCKIWMNQAAPAEPASSTAPKKLHIKGTADDVKLACNVIAELLASAPIVSKRLCESGVDNADVLLNDIVTEVVEFPVRLLGLLIGKNGWTLKRIIRTSGASITINQRVLPNQPKRVLIYGRVDNVRYAKQLVERILLGGTDVSNPAVFQRMDEELKMSLMREFGRISAENKSAESTVTSISIGGFGDLVKMHSNEAPAKQSPPMVTPKIASGTDVHDMEALYESLMTKDSRQAGRFPESYPAPTSRPSASTSYMSERERLMPPKAEYMDAVLPRHQVVHVGLNPLSEHARYAPQPTSQLLPPVYAHPEMQKIYEQYKCEVPEPRYGSRDFYQNSDNQPYVNRIYSRPPEMDASSSISNSVSYLTSIPGRSNGAEDYRFPGKYEYLPERGNVEVFPENAYFKRGDEF